MPGLSFKLSNETLRPRVAEREVASAISTEARPFARSTVVGSEVGTKLKGLDQRLSQRTSVRPTKKGLYAPLLPISGAGSNLGEIYITFGATSVSWITKFTAQLRDLYQSALISV